MDLQTIDGTLAVTREQDAPEDFDFLLDAIGESIAKRDALIPFLQERIARDTAMLEILTAGAPKRNGRGPDRKPRVKKAGAV